MTRSLFPLMLLLLASGCSSAEFNETMDRGLAYETEARKLEKRENFAEAAPLYAKAAVDLKASLKMAEKRQITVFVSFLTAKLSIVSAGQGRCLQPDNNKTSGSWEKAISLFLDSAGYADEVQMLKLKSNAVSARGYCMRPDKNPQGSWAKAAALYAKAAKICKKYENDEGRGENLRHQAICLLEGNLKQKWSLEVRKLLGAARRLGDEEAAHILSSAKSRFCSVCGTDLDKKTRFCPRCGHDQAEVKKKKDKDPKPKKLGKFPGNHPPGVGPRGGTTDKP